MGAVEREPVEAQVLQQPGRGEPLQQHARRAPVGSEHELDEVGREQHDAAAERQHPQERRAVGLLEQLLQRIGAPADRDDRRVDRRRDDLVRAIDVAGHRRRERDVARGHEPAVQLERDHLSLRHRRRRQQRHQHPAAEAPVAPGDVAVEAQRQPVWRDPQPDGHGDQIPGRRTDHQRPDAEPGRRERQRDRDRHHRLDHLQRTLLRIVHPPEEDPQRRQQRKGDRQVRARQREPQQLRFAVGHRQHGREHDQRDRQHGRQRQLQRERVLELRLGVVGLLLHERFVDPDALDRQHGRHRHGDQPVEPDRLGPEQPRDHQPLRGDDRVDPDDERRRDRGPADGAPPQVAAHAPRLAASSRSAPTAASTTSSGSAAIRKRVKP